MYEKSESPSSLIFQTPHSTGTCHLALNPVFPTYFVDQNIYRREKKNLNPCHLARTFLCKYSWYDLYQQQILKYFSSLLQSSWHSQPNKLRGRLRILPRKSLLPKKPSRKAAHPCNDRQSQLSRQQQIQSGSSFPSFFQARIAARGVQVSTHPPRGDDDSQG